LVICAIQFIVTFAQWMGVTEFAFRSYSQATKAIIGNQGRMVGLYEHPGMLGKTILLLLCFLLVLAVRRSRITRKLAYFSIALGVFATLLTLSRANSAAILVALILWPILKGNGKASAKILGATIVVGSFIAINTSVFSDLINRQEADPFGGPRGQLLEIGIDQIQAAPLTGTGPNYYNEVVGQYDALAAGGLPVHNSVLLAVAELGFPLAMVVFAFPMIAISQAARRIVRTKTIDSQSATLLAILPGIAFAGWTGWGLMGIESLPLWFMAFGFLSSRREETQSEEGHADRHGSMPSSTQPFPLRA
jgi:O-antigen ligase